MNAPPDPAVVLANFAAYGGTIKMPHDTTVWEAVEVRPRGWTFGDQVRFRDRDTERVGEVMSMSANVGYIGETTVTIDTVDGRVTVDADDVIGYADGMMRVEVWFADTAHGGRYRWPMRLAAKIEP